MSIVDFLGGNGLDRVRDFIGVLNNLCLDKLGKRDKVELFYLLEEISIKIIYIQDELWDEIYGEKKDY